MAVCGVSHALVGEVAGLRMEARLARATIEVTDDCSFAVYGLEVAGGNENGTALWTYARDDAALEDGDVHLLVDMPPSVPSSGVMGGPYNATLSNGVAWDAVGVVSLWEVSQAGNLASGRSLASTLMQDLSPGSSTRTVRAESLTTFTDCAELQGDGLHLRWSLILDANGIPESVDFGLEGEDIASSGYVSFGPADPTSAASFMIGSDPVIAGFMDGDVMQPYVVDSYISGYSACDITGSVSGACADATWSLMPQALAMSASASPEVTLRAAERVNSVSLFRWRRPLAATNVGTDHAINVSAAMKFVWAVGGVDSTTESASQHLPNLNQHGSSGYGIETLMLDSSTVQYCSSTLRYTEPSSGGTILGGTIPPASAFDYTLMLSSNVVKVSWTLNEGQNRAEFRVEAMRPGNWASITWGKSMGDGYAYVGFVNAGGSGTSIGVRSYRLSGYSESSVTEVSSTISGVVVEQSSDGKLTFVFTASVGRGSGGGAGYFENWNVPVLWAVGDTWTEGSALRASNVHSARSPSAEYINLSTGVKGAAELNWILILHGIFMFIAWGVSIPAAVLIARFLKALPDAFWFVWHIRVNYSAILVGGIGIVLSFADGFIRDLHLNSTHSILGLSMILLWIAQVFFATIVRPGKDAGELRTAWELGHRFVAIICLVLAFFTMGYGLEDMQARTGRYMGNFTLALQIWSGCLGLIAIIWQVHAYTSAAAINEMKVVKTVEADEVA